MFERKKRHSLRSGSSDKSYSSLRSKRRFKWMKCFKFRAKTDSNCTVMGSKSFSFRHFICRLVSWLLLFFSCICMFDVWTRYVRGKKKKTYLWKEVSFACGADKHLGESKAVIRTEN